MRGEERHRNFNLTHKHHPSNNKHHLKMKDKKEAQQKIDNGTELRKEETVHVISFTPENLKFLNSVQDPVLGIVGMQKNEKELLPYWLEYHSKIVDVNNIVILDSYSDDQETLKLLQDWKAKGLTVLYNQGPYKDKGTLTAQAFKILPKVDIAIPLDIDEFMISFHHDQPFISRRKILNSLKYFWYTNYSCLSLQQYYPNANIFLNDTLETISRFHKGLYNLVNSKKIAKTKDLAKFDHGNHQAKFYLNNPKRPTATTNRKCLSGLYTLGLLHYHYINPKSLALRAIHDLIGFGKLPQNFTLEEAMQKKDFVAEISRENRDGGHKAKELLQYITQGPVSLLHAANGDYAIAPVLPEMVKLIGA
jgi:hypothetical protein